MSEQKWELYLFPRHEKFCFFPYFFVENKERNKGNLFYRVFLPPSLFPQFNYSLGKKRFYGCFQCYFYDFAITFFSKCFCRNEIFCLIIITELIVSVFMLSPLNVEITDVIYANKYFIILLLLSPYIADN